VITDKPFGRYAIQYEKRTFAQIHIKIGVEFGADKIQEKFMESLEKTEELDLSNA
jgi:hypothetical protein